MKKSQPQMTQIAQMENKRQNSQYTRMGGTLQQVCNSSISI